MSGTQLVLICDCRICGGGGGGDSGDDDPEDDEPDGREVCCWLVGACC